MAILCSFYSGRALIVFTGVTPNECDSFGLFKRNIYIDIGDRITLASLKNLHRFLLLQTVTLGCEFPPVLVPIGWGGGKV
jgi:hypothetical protein